MMPAAKKAINARDFNTCRRAGGKCFRSEVKGLGKRRAAGHAPRQIRKSSRLALAVNLRFPPGRLRTWARRRCIREVCCASCGCWRERHRLRSDNEALLETAVEERSLADRIRILDKHDPRWADLSAAGFCSSSKNVASISLLKLLKTARRCHRARMATGHDFRLAFPMLHWLTER